MSYTTVSTIKKLGLTIEIERNTAAPNTQDEFFANILLPAGMGSATLPIKDNEAITLPAVSIGLFKIPVNARIVNLSIDPPIVGSAPSKMTFTIALVTQGIIRVTIASVPVSVDIQ